MESEFAHAQAIVDAVYQEVNNQYQSIVFSEKYAIASRKAQLQNIVGISIDLIRLNYNKYKQGLISETEAKRLSIEQLKNMRYDDGTGYLWVNDDTTPIPRMIMHAAMPDLDGKFWMIPASKGSGKQRKPFVTFREIGTQFGSGFVEYLWPSN